MGHDASDCRDEWGKMDPCPIATLMEMWELIFTMLQEVDSIILLIIGLFQLMIYPRFISYMECPNEPAEKIEFCTTLMYIGNLLTRYYSGLLTWFFEDHTAFMTEELDLWYNGGLADMGANV
jgi:hypothetical protein